MHWVWDENKNAANRQKHKLSFEIASLVFNDPLAVSRPDDYSDEERWHTVGMVGPVIILVVHTVPDMDIATGEETGRIISARKATPHERRAYEEGDFH